MVIKIMAILLGVFFTTQPATACADETHTDYSNTQLQISEIYPSPNEGEEEFIEIYNNGNTRIDLTNWKIGDASGKMSTLSEQSIEAGDYFSITHSTSKIYLNNGGDSVMLIAPDESIIDETTYEDSQSGESWALFDTEWQWTNTPTPGKKNTTTTTEKETPAEKTPSYETSEFIFINELLPNPSGSDTTDEWIELINEGEKTIQLFGWSITDENRTYTLEDTSIAPEEHLIIEVTESRISLNNNGDRLYLIDPFDKIIQGVEYDTAKEDQSWSRFGNDWQWADPTAGEKNILPLEEEELIGINILSTAEFRELENDEIATIEVTATVQPGIFGSQYFYAQDSSAGIQVYSYSKLFPEIEAGDLLRITGKKSESRGEVRIKTSEESDIEIIGKVNIPEAQTTPPQEENEGMLITITGTLTELSSKEAIIEDEFHAIFKNGAEINTNDLEEGNTVTIIGITSQYDDSYRFFPRSQDDITTEKISLELIPAAEAKTLQTITPSTKSNQTYLLTIFVILGLLIILIQQKIQSKKQRHELPSQMNLLQKKRETTSLKDVASSDES